MSPFSISPLSYDTVVSSRFDSPDTELLADLTVAAAQNLDRDQTVEAYREVLTQRDGEQL